MSDPLPTVRFPLRLAEDGTVWQDDGDGLDAECIEHINDLPAEADRWRNDAERLAGSLRYLLDDAWIVAWEGPTGRYYKRSVTGQRDIGEAQAALAAHDAMEEQP